MTINLKEIILAVVAVEKGQEIDKIISFILI